MDSGQKEEAQAEEGLIKEYPATSMAAVPSPVPDISPTERTSLSPLCRLVVFQGCPNAMWAPTLNQLNCGNDLFFAGLLLLPDDMEPFYNRVLSVKSNIFKACTMSWPQLKKTILEVAEALTVTDGRLDQPGDWKKFQGQGPQNADQLREHVAAVPR